MRTESAPMWAIGADSVRPGEAADGSLPTQRLFGFDFVSCRDLEVVAEQVLGPQPDDGRLPFVLTPNVDYLVRLDEPANVELADQLRRSRYVLPDGQPIVWASWLRGRPLAARLPGSSLFPPLWRRIVAEQRRTVVVASTEETAARLKAEHPGLGIVVPPFFDADDPDQLAKVVHECQEQLDEVDPEFVFIGISFPKQQRIALALVEAYEERGERAPIMLTLGASFEMYLGLCSRAPRWMQRSGLEWFFRFLQEPRRLFRRYFVTDLKFAWLALREVIARPG